MRSSVVGSMILHGVVVGALVRLTPPMRPTLDKYVTVDFTTTKAPEPAPKPPEPEPPAPLPKAAEPVSKVKVAPKANEPVDKARPPETPQPAAPSVSAETPTAKPEESSTNVLLPRRAPGVDLKLHSLPTGVVGGQADRPMPAPAPKAEWKPRGSAGDPLLGKVDEEKEDPFPLTKMSDGWVYKGPAFNAKILLDGSVAFDDKNIRDFKGLSGSFDLTELVMRGKKQDPYRREKEKFLKHTEPMRDRLLSAARQARIRHSLDNIKYELASVWSDTTKPASDRRATIYAMWKETVTTDKDLEESATEARGIVEKFIKKHLPEGSTDAYTQEELTRWKSGKIPFDPYRD